MIKKPVKPTKVVKVAPEVEAKVEIVEVAPIVEEVEVVIETPVVYASKEEELVAKLDRVIESNIKTVERRLLTKEEVISVVRSIL